jgi:uncharacterized damage-inducible protein DinB
MDIKNELIPEFEQEMKTTRRLLERVPFDKGTWKPHEKSFALGHLAQLVAWIPDWVRNAAAETEMDLAKAPKYSFEKTETLLEMFDKNVREAKAALTRLDESRLGEDWSLKMGEQVFLTMNRGGIIRMHINHLIHHRGQLTVYLRLVDVPLPPIYGPTADERAM